MSQCLEASYYKKRKKMKSPDGRPNGKGPASLMKQKFMPRAINYGVFNPSSRKAHNLDTPPTFINPVRSQRELNRRLNLPKQRAKHASNKEDGVLHLPASVNKAIAVTQKFADSLHETLFVVLQGAGCSWLATRQDRINFGLSHPEVRCLVVKPTYSR